MCGVETGADWDRERGELVELVNGQLAKAVVRGKLELEFFILFVRAVASASAASGRNLSPLISIGPRNAMGLLASKCPEPRFLAEFLDEQFTRRADSK